MDEIAQRYQGRADEINKDREKSIKDVNVVVVLSESFTDPSWMEGFELDENPIPNTQQIMSETTSGQSYASAYGGGTSTMEFESLTGQPIGLFQPQVTSPYQMFVSDYKSYPSAVGAFEADGHHTVAMHAYNLHMYKRSEVYKTLGFDEVIDDSAMQSKEHLENSPYISDASAFSDVVHQVDTQEDPLFMNLVTMQNHGPYPGYYKDPIGYDAEGTSQSGELGQYTRGLSYSDEAMSQFLDDLQTRDEETIVVFYGDHHPGVYSQDILAANEPDASMRTPYFVWSSKTNEYKAGGAITPAMLMPAVYDVADAKVPPYIALLDDVKKETPVIQQGRMLDPEGNEVDTNALDPEAQGRLDDLRAVQYDFSIGDRYAVDKMWPQAKNE
nr:sulfatase-like hydrolase/transferase [Kocuria sp. JC486]